MKFKLENKHELDMFAETIAAFQARGVSFKVMFCEIYFTATIIFT